MRNIHPIRNTRTLRGIVRVLLLAFSLVGLPFQIHAAHAAGTGSPFPDLTLPPLADTAQFQLPEGASRLSHLPEKIIIINVYSWFCGPCQAEGDDLRQLAERIGDHGTNGAIRIIGIAAGDDPALAEKFRAKHKLSYPLYADPDLALHKRMDSPPVPTFFVVRNSPEGPRLLFTHTGAILGKSAQFLQEVEDNAGQ